VSIRLNLCDLFCTNPHDVLKRVRTCRLCSRRKDLHLKVVLHDNGEKRKASLEPQLLIQTLELFALRENLYTVNFEFVLYNRVSLYPACFVK